MTLHRAIITLLMSGSFFSLAQAREAYLRHVPSPFECTTCHDDPRQGRQNAQIRNGFGFDYVAARQQWSEMCQLDSDGDGITNAVELLDPECTWRPAPIGQPNTPLPIGIATHPGDPRDPDQCGDNILQGSEDCDGINLGSSSCENLGYASGTLRCSPTCDFDETACIDSSATDMFTPEPDMGLDDMGTRDMNGLDMSLGDMSAPDQLDVMLEQSEQPDVRDLGVRDRGSERDGIWSEIQHSSDADLAIPTASSPSTGCTHLQAFRELHALILLGFFALLRRR